MSYVGRPARTPWRFSMRRTPEPRYENERDDWVLDDSDRITPPQRRGGGRFAMGASLLAVTMIAGAGAIATSGHQLSWPTALLNFATVDPTTPVIDAVRQPVAKAAPRPAKYDSPPPLPTTTVKAAAPLPPEPPAQVQPARTPPPGAADDGTVREIRPAYADPNDPLQMRAAAVGLHPQLPRHLLARLTATDFRNAGIAIRTAVAETPEGSTYVWPRQRGPELATFQVRIVRAMDAACRRYVVAVIKDGWATTAQPIETCELPPAPMPTARRN